jgi:hypothetical protein
VQDRFEPRWRVAVRENELAQARAVERPVGTAIRGAEGRQHRRVPGFARRGERVRKTVGIGDIDAALRERIGHDRLAAADPAGESDDKGHVPSLRPRERLASPAGFIRRAA